jgi:hypothetical protein
LFNVCRRQFSMLTALLLSLPLAFSVVEASPGRVDAALVDSRGGPVRLSEFRGKPVVLFYEDRASSEQNARLKRALSERAEARRLTGAAHVLGVANVAPYDFWPARNFVLSSIREVERRDRVRVLVDWKRALLQPPWSLPDATSSVVLLDAEGRWVHAWSGPVQDKSLEEFFQALEQLLKEPSAAL